MSDLLFVYGTLLSGGSNAWRMQNSAVISDAWVHGILLDIGDFPGLILGGEEKVHGEVRQILATDLPALDTYESAAYRRLKAEVHLPDESKVIAWTYEWLNDPKAHPKIPGGNWLAHKAFTP